jgi:hypothetical protein
MIPDQVEEKKIDPQSKRRNPFKGDNGNFYTKSLFFEYRYDTEDQSLVIYTLKDEDHTFNGKKYLSLKRLYLECSDPTEYSFATTYLGGIDHWENLQKLSWFKDFPERWRKELDLKLKSEALSRIIRTSKAGGKESFVASRYILEKGWSPEGKRGRPSKEELNRIANDAFSSANRLNDDYNRLGIN